VTLWLVIGLTVLAALIVLLVAVNEVRVSRRLRVRPVAPITGPWPRTHYRDVVELDWSADPERERLGRLQQ
jgi:hypothetical protein